MTSICGGGTSSPQPGVGGVLTIGGAAIEVFISTVLALPEMAPILAPIIAGLIDIQIAAYCGTDPPSDPGLTADIVADAIKIPPSFTTFDSQKKILQWFESRYWYQVCQCNSITTPQPPTLSNPGPASSNPGFINVPTPCWKVTVAYDVLPHSTTNSGYVSYTAQAQPPGAEILTNISFPGGPVLLQTAFAMPAGALNLSLQATLDQPIVNSLGHVDVVSNPFNSLGNPGPPGNLQVVFDSTGLASGNVYTVPRMDSTEAYRALSVGNDDTIEHTGTLTFSFFCNPGTPTPTACCPPDPMLEGELQQILQYVQAIYAGLPIPPNSFAEGTAHSGLTGNGSITFSGVPIALKVTLTTIPPALGFEVGSPSFYFDVGYLSFSTSEGSYSQERLTLEQQVLQVPLLAGSVGYTLKNGVIATVTELLPGP